MRKPFTALLVFAAMLSAAAAVHANDSAAERAAGGLVFKQSADIDMVSEDLFVSADEVRVRYVFRNRAPQDVRVTVAFPLPDHDLAEDFYGDVAYPSGFATRVDGRPVTMAVEQRALRGGTDHTALLAGLGIPIMYGEAGSSRSSAPCRRCRWPIATGLVALDLAEPIGRADRRRITPSGRFGRRATGSRPSRPGATSSSSTATGPEPARRPRPALAHPEYLRGEGRQAMIDRYCIDEAFLAAVDRGTRQAGGGQPAYSEQWVSYILTTGANWRSPIGDFRLVVDKGDPSHLVSFCGEGVRRIGPTRFEVRHRNWRPTRDLDILILRPIRAGD